MKRLLQILSRGLTSDHSVQYEVQRELCNNLVLSTAVLILPDPPLIGKVINLGDSDFSS